MTRFQSITQQAEVEKYELGGVSLRRINKITTSINTPIDIDSYYQN